MNVRATRFLMYLVGSMALEGFRYRWWPRPVAQVDYVSLAALPPFLASLGVVMAILCVPLVVRVTGVPAHIVLPLTGVYGAWVVFSVLMSRRYGSRPWAFALAAGGDLLLGLVVCFGLVVASGNPMSLLWICSTIFASFNGAMVEMDPSLGFLIAHTAVPLLAIPFLRASGADGTQAIAGPLIASGLSGMCYHFLATRTDVARQAIRAREATQQQRAALDMQQQRERIARDVHDSVGPALGMAALYGDLAAQGKVPDDAMAGILGEVGTSARATLRDLRGVLNAIERGAQRAAELVAEVRVLGERSVVPAGMSLVVDAVGDLQVLLAPSVLATAFRIIQESFTNAIRHSRARGLAITIAVEGGPVPRLRVDVADDGVGFEVPGDRGRGLTGMSRRAAEVDGVVHVDSAPGRGTRVRIDLPIRGGA